MCLLNVMRHVRFYHGIHENSGIIMLKVKRKLEFRGNVYFQAVRPHFILDELNWLELNNPLYNNITIDIENISAKLTSLEQDDNMSGINFDKNEKSLTEKCKQHITNDNDTEERDDPLNEHRQVANETCLQSVLPDYPVTIQSNKNCSLGNEVYNITPGENKHPVSIMRDTM